MFEQPKTDIFKLIEESRRDFELIKNRPDLLEVLHCRSCGNHCSLSAPGCGRGMRAAAAVKAHLREQGDS